MMDKDALQWLRDHVEHYKIIGTVESESDLVAMSTDSRILSLEEFQAAPNQISQTVKLRSAGSLIEYVNRFKNEASTIYLNVDGSTFVAVLDHHEKDAPAWGRHLATFEAKPSLEWLAWSGINGQQLSQLELAHFIEANLDDIVTPEPAEMLKAALEFESVEKMAYASAQSLDDGGVRFNFTKENTNASVSFPHRIKVLIPVIENEKAHTLEARVRYKTTSDGVLTFVITFVRNLQQIKRDTLIMLGEDIRIGVKLETYEGVISGNRR